MFPIIDNWVQHLIEQNTLNKYRRKLKENKKIDLVEEAVPKLQMVSFINKDLTEAERLIYLQHTITKWMVVYGGNNKTQLWVKSVIFKPEYDTIFSLSIDEMVLLNKQYKKEKIVSMLGDIPVCICIGPIINPEHCYNYNCLKL